MHWLFMIGAILFEVVGTLSLKFSAGFTRPMFVALTVVGYVASFGLLGIALKGIPVSAAYAIWAGLGTTLVALVGIFFLNEPGGMIRFVSMALIVIGVVGLHTAERLAG